MTEIKISKKLREVNSSMSDSGKQALSVPKATTRAGLAKNIGRRLRAAREVANIPQIVAAKRLGYSNPSKLAKIEGGTDTNSVPHWMILKASRLYCVSIDYIYGESDDWELSAKAYQERDMDKWIFDTWEEARQRDMEVLKKLKIRFDSLNETVTQLFSASQDVQDAMQKFVQLNRDTFEDMRGGNRLISSLERLLSVSVSCKKRVTRYSHQCHVSDVGVPIVYEIERQKQEVLL